VVTEMNTPVKTAVPRGDARHRADDRVLLRAGAALHVLARIGPEMVAGASDNDPTNIGAAVVAGARTGYQLSWVAILVAPLLAVVQAIAAHVGVVARGDLQSLAIKRYGRRAAAVLMVSVVVVNVVTIGADLQAGAAAIGMLAGADPRWMVLPLGLAVTGLLLTGNYDKVVAALRYLLLGFAAFAAAAVLAHPDWPEVARATLAPALSLHGAELASGLALLGTTMTSYVFVWETIERGAEEPAGASPDGCRLASARAGAVVSGVFTAAVLWFMLVASAATLGLHHQAAASAQDAARALRPLAGPLAADLFAAGLIVSALVALPVLMASSAYVIGAQFGWRRGLSERPGRAPAFYAVMAASVGLACAAALAGVPVLGMLVAASVIGGLGSPVGMVVLIRLARDRQVMGGRPISGMLAMAGWAATIIVGGLGVLFIVGAATGSL
jgi:Mn2+/Fe2+ NRAMP family transporter